MTDANFEYVRTAYATCRVLPQLLVCAASVRLYS